MSHIVLILRYPTGQPCLKTVFQQCCHPQHPQCKQVLTLMVEYVVKFNMYKTTQMALFLILREALSEVTTRSESESVSITDLSNLLETKVRFFFVAFKMIKEFIELEVDFFRLKHIGVSVVSLFWNLNP